MTNQIFGIFRFLGRGAQLVKLTNTVKPKRLMVPRGYSTCNQNGKLDSGALVKIKRMSTLHNRGKD